MSEKLICLDIILEGKDFKAVEKIRKRVSHRKPIKGTFHYRDGQGEHRRSYLVGGESIVLSGIAKRKLNGKLTGVDGIFKGGINVAGVVSKGELKRLTQEQNFTVLCEIDVGAHR